MQAALTNKPTNSAKAKSPRTVRDGHKGKNRNFQRTSLPELTLHPTPKDTSFLQGVW